MLCPTDTQQLKDVAMSTIFVFLYIWGNTTEPFVCGGDKALCEITLTTCYYRLQYERNCVLTCHVRIHLDFPEAKSFVSCV